MGLYATINLHDLGFYPTTRNAGVAIDYSYGNGEFETVFHSFISSYCPVRTGNLLSSIHCEARGMEIDVYTQCEYAQHVEYGTALQDAQPYFEQAVEEAFSVAYDSWVLATEEALMIEYDWVYNDVYSQVMSDQRAASSPTFAERWAHNAATVSVESQRTYLDIGPITPATIII